MRGVAYIKKTEEKKTHSQIHNRCLIRRFRAARTARRTAGRRCDKLDGVFIQKRKVRHRASGSDVRVNAAQAVISSEGRRGRRKAAGVKKNPCIYFPHMLLLPAAPCRHLDNAARVSHSLTHAHTHTQRDGGPTSNGDANKRRRPSDKRLRCTEKSLAAEGQSHAVLRFILFLCDYYWLGEG